MGNGEEIENRGKKSRMTERWGRKPHAGRRVVGNGEEIENRGKKSRMTERWGRKPHAGRRVAVGRGGGGARAAIFAAEDVPGSIRRGERGDSVGKGDSGAQSEYGCNRVELTARNSRCDDPTLLPEPILTGSAYLFRPGPFTMRAPESG